MPAGGERRPPLEPSAAPPWQFLMRAVAVIAGLTMLLIVDVRGVVFYIAWTLIVLATISEGASTLVHLRRSRHRGA